MTGWFCWNTSISLSFQKRMCRDKWAASDRLVRKASLQQFWREEGFEKLLAWTAAAARFLSGAGGEIQTELLCDLIEEQTHGAIVGG
jgi:hypothetical protein